MKKTLVFVLLGVFLIGLASAEVQEVNPIGITTNGTYLYVLDIVSDLVIEYDFDGEYTGNYFNVTNQSMGLAYGNDTF